MNFLAGINILSSGTGHFRPRQRTHTGQHAQAGDGGNQQPDRQRQAIFGHSAIPAMNVGVR